jgi:RHS repeat-associated protein
MATNYGKKNIAHKGSNHGAVAPGAMSLVTPPAPPAPTPFVYVARSINASDTSPKLLIDKKEVLVKGSTMSLDPPANQPAQAGGGDVVTHGTKNIAVMTTGSVCFTVDGKEVCGVGDIALMNVPNKNMKIAQMQVPLLEGADFETARGSYAAAAAMNRSWRRAYPPSKANQCRAGHPVDMGTGYVVDDAVDLRLPGFIPLIWSRSYTSSSASHRGALGKGGWTHSFESWLEGTESGYRLHDEQGLPVEFAPPDDAGLSLCRGKGLELSRQSSTFEVRGVRDRLTRTFSALPGGRLALRSISDARNHRIRLDYEGNHLTRIVDSVGREIHLTNDAKGRVTRVEVWASEPGSGRPPALQTWFDYAYHAEGELASHANALGHAETWEYDGLHRMVKTTLRNGVSFYYEYDPEAGHCVHTWGDGGLHDLHIEVDFDKGETRTHGTNRARRYLWKNGLVWREETFGGEWAVERIYDDDELLVVRKNGVGEATTYEYDARGHLVRETDAAGNVSAWKIREDLPVRYIGPTGLETQYAHDQWWSLVGIAFPTGLTYYVDRDPEGMLAAIHDGDGVRARLTYDEHGNLATETQARGATTRYRHDALGRPIEQTDAIGRTSTVRYDVLGAVLELRHPDGTSLAATYDRLGNLATTTDTLGHVTRLEHAGTGHFARVTQANGQIYRLVYDEDERLTQIVNPRLERYEFEYDHADQIVAERTFDQRLLSYRYNKAGRLVRVDYPEDEWREFSHDKLGNVLEDRGEDVQIVFDRDALGRVEKATCQDVTGKVVTEFERDVCGRVTADIQNGRAVRYEYDARGLRSARVLPGGERTEYHYDLDDAFAGVTHDGTKVAIDRDALGRERTRRARGWALESEYDRMDRLVSQRAYAPEPGRASKMLAEHRYSYDAKGRVTAVESSQGGLTTYRYDSIDQLLEAARGSAREVFEYDPTGSLVNALSDLGAAGRTLPWAMAPGNVLKATGKAGYVNDGRGRRIRRVDGKGLDGSSEKEQVTTYGWDTKDRLREVVLPDGGRVRFTYDALGRRVRKDVLGPAAPLAEVLAGTVPAVERRSVTFLWDADVLCEEVDSSKSEGSRSRVHVHEPGTFVPMLQVEQGQVFGVVNDHLGMPKELVDGAGRIAWRAQHGAWGNVLDVARDERAAEIASPFRLLGQYADEEAGVCYTRFRYFDAGTGRWLCADPLGVDGGTNIYAMDGSPSMVVDPLGLCAPKDGDPAQAFLDRALALQGMTSTTGSFKQKWTEDDRTFEARIHPAEAAHGKTGSIFRVGRQAVADPANPKAQGSGQSYVDPAGNWHHQSTLIPTFANGTPNPQYDPVAAKDTHIQL